MQQTDRKIQVVLASKNGGKVRELHRLLGEPRIELVSMKDLVPENFEVPETGATFEENAWIKAEALCRLTKMPTVSDDSGLEVDALDGRPGVFSARYAGPSASDEENNRLLLSELSHVPLQARGARFRCALAFVLPRSTAGGPSRVSAVHGVVEGRILLSARGEGGFGYDPLFEPLEYPGRTTAEISEDEKDKISHRGRAAALLRSDLRTWLDGLF